MPAPSFALNRRRFLQLLGFGAVAAAGLPLLRGVRALAQAPAPRKVVIVGGGVAGLCAAYELERLGHDCVILEAEPRHVGGRVRTAQFGDGLYGEMGAMRIPTPHDLTRHYVAEFGLQLRRFVMDNPMTYLIARGRKVRARDIGDLAELYDLAPEERGRTPGDFWEQSIVDRLAGLTEAERADLFAIAPSLPRIRTLDRRSLIDLWREAGLSLEAMEYLAVTYGLEPFLSSAATEHLRETIDGVWTSGFDEIVGGTYRLPSAFAAALRTPLRQGCEVIRLERDAADAPVAAVYRHNGLVERESGDALICTLPFGVLERVDVAQAFSPAKRRAIRELHYDSSTKTLAAVRRRFWESGDGIFGGGSMSDRITGTTWYPSDNAETRDPAVSAGPGVLLASYTWNASARRQSSLDDEARGAMVLDSVADWHPELGEPGMVLARDSWSWDRNPWSSGAYAFFKPGQHTDLYADIVRPEGAIHIAGEHASLNHSWIQGALESALRAVRSIHAEAAD
jgi:monoamine oxidase